MSKMSRNCRLMILKAGLRYHPRYLCGPSFSISACYCSDEQMQLVSRISQLENRGGFLFVPPFLPRVFRTRFTLSRGTIPERNRGKRIAQRSMWQEKDRCRGLFLIEIQLPRFQVLEMFLCETGSEERMSRGEKKLSKEKRCRG